MKTNKQLALSNLRSVSEAINDDRLHEALRLLSTVRDDLNKAIQERKAFDRRFR